MLPPLTHAVARIELRPGQQDCLYARYGTIVQTTEQAAWMIGCDALTICRLLHRAGAQLTLYRVPNPANLDQHVG